MIKAGAQSLANKIAIPRAAEWHVTLAQSNRGQCSKDTEMDRREWCRVINEFSLAVSVTFVKKSMVVLQLSARRIEMATGVNVRNSRR
jgi:hypothetical protein